MEAFELNQVIAQHGAGGEAYHQFLSRGSLSLGLYVLPAGGDDPQSPHAEDEVYYVVSGRATIRVGDEDRPVKAGSMVFVARNVPHRFHAIEDELRLLVFFAPEHTPAS